MGVFSFLKHKNFYIHLGIAVIISFLLLWLTFQFLSIYTRHGDTLVLPDFYGMTIKELKNDGFEKDFTFVVTDSVYDPTKKKGTIIQQNPLPSSIVKKDRKVYVTIIAKLPEKVSMPNLIDLSLRQALVMLESAGLKVNHLDYKPHFAENAVLKQLYQNEEIEPGTLIEKNAKINLVIGSGYSKKKLPVPFLIGKDQKEAINIIHKSSYNIGKEYFLDGRDTVHARVYRQEPAWDSDKLLEHGEYINLWYRSNELFDFEEYLKSLFPDTTIADTALADQPVEN